MSSGADYWVPTFLIKINKDRISQEMAADIMRVSVVEKLDLPALFMMTLSDRETKWAAEDKLSAGNEITVELGYLNETVELFNGEITGLRAEFSSEGPAQVTIKGYDRLHRLARNKKTKTFKDMKDKQIVQEIVSDVSLQLDADVEGEKNDMVFQNSQTNLEFIRERAERLGAEVGVSGKKMLFKKPQENSSEAATLEWGKSLLEFVSDLTVISQVSKVTVHGWDPKEQTVVTGEAASDSQNPGLGVEKSGAQIAKDEFGDNELVIMDNSVRSRSEAENIAQARFREISLRYNQSEGRCLGNPKIRVGKIISMKGLGDKLNGKYYVVATQHELSRAGYVTGFKACRHGQ